MKIMPEDKLPIGKTVAFSLQQLFACFSAIVLVPIIVGLPTNVALFSAGIGTIIFLFCTGYKTPLILGSSFAYIGALVSTSVTYGWGATSVAIIASGLFYVLIAIVISRVGLGWLDKVFPPVVIGSVIVVIGMCLLPGTVTAAFGGGENYSLTNVLVGLFTMTVIAVIATVFKGFVRAIPVLTGIVVGFLLVVVLYLTGVKTDFGGFQPVIDAPWFVLPIGPGFGEWSFRPAAVAVFLVVSIATLVEHIGDIFTISSIVGRDFYKAPGLHRTLIGDGLATVFAGFSGSVPNTSYSECAATQALSGVHSIRVIIGASIAMIALSFCGKFGALVSVIPWSVINGGALILYGAIASSGLRRILDGKTDFDDPRNLVICSSILTIGIGSVLLKVGDFSLNGVALATVVGIVLNLALPKKKSAV